MRLKLVDGITNCRERDERIQSEQSVRGKSSCVRDRITKEMGRGGGQMECIL